MKDKKYLCSIREASSALGVGRTKTYDMLAKGELSSIHIGSRRLVKVDSIEALIDRATGDAI